jgi:prophage regulatory protein
LNTSFIFSGAFFNSKINLVTIFSKFITSCTGCSCEPVFLKWLIRRFISVPLGAKNNNLLKGTEMKQEITENQIQLLTAKQLGARLSLSKRQIFRLNSCGKLPAPVRIGGSVRWSEETIARWIAAGAPDRRTFEIIQHAGNN